MQRPLSDVEEANWLFDQAVSVSFVMVAHISGPLTESILRQALDMAQKKYPPLRWKIKEGSVPEFVTEGVPKIPLRIIERKSKDHWLEEAEAEMHKQFPWTKGPLVRVVQLVSKNKNECDLLFTFCHIASDGLSGVIVVKDILTFAGKLSRGETLEPPTPLPTPLSSIDLLKKELKYEPDLSGTKDSIDLHKPVELEAEKEVPPHKRITRILHKELSQSEVKQLAKKCKEEKTSVHGTLFAAFLQAVVEQIRKTQDVPQKGPLNIGALSPVNIRHHFIKPVPEDIGYYISFAIHHQLVDEHSSFWETAKKIKEALETEIKAGQDIKAILGVGDTLKTTTTPIELVREVNASLPPVGITNLGNVDIPQQYGDLRLKKFHFTVAISVGSKSGLGMTIMTFAGIMTINFLFSEPYRSRQKTEIIAEAMMKRLRRVIEKERKRE
ncbi:MAG: hypothetical protein GTO45_31480 [Candidatus Aminicenantes bacterium]|nr:hypothetical protein [Candidatus Aminicenantes bacterium]NIM83331.1 hypothetical protein [Candidatus Aminicenantes bacterium]NIN22690.1 hypothetical protein [Candidatus Aminicenantes bacterium]NIN46450.1 hypothetical protein [Candidatus Aminicenantes bacterium]NIN89302.1 hypothetical protein [Candidatus Aminicenantes bacterium]